MFYDKLNAICREQGTSPSSVALALGMSKSNITRWKAGQTPKIATVRALADYLKVDFWELLDSESKDTEAEASELDRRFMRLLGKLSDYQKKMVLAQVEGLLRMKE